jgi:hypothetical protein
MCCECVFLSVVLYFIFLHVGSCVHDYIHAVRTSFAAAYSGVRLVYVV